MEEIPTIVWVVAGALRDPQGRFLMHRRPSGKEHGGLWEFPGGKIESGETPALALSRELDEELGVQISLPHTSPASFAERSSHGDYAGLVILLYTVTRWSGKPVALQEGAAVEWFGSMEIVKLDLPPLDRILAHRLFGTERLPARL